MTPAGSPDGRAKAVALLTEATHQRQLPDAARGFGLLCQLVDDVVDDRDAMLELALLAIGAFEALAAAENREVATVLAEVGSFTANIEPRRL